MTDRLQKLLELSDQSEKAELSLANNGWVKAMGAFKDKPGKQTKEDLDAARAFLDETRERLTAKYFPEETLAPEGERFKNRKQAFDWLQAQGYKVSRGKFYGDCEDGHPAVHRDGTVSRYQVLQYAQQQDVGRKSIDPGESKDSDDRKAKADADIAEMKAEEMRRNISNNWLSRDDAFEALAALAGSIQASLRHHFTTGQSRLLLLAGGDQERGPELFEGIEEIIAAAMNEVAVGDIEGIFEEV